MTAPSLARYQDIAAQAVPSLWQGAADDVFVVTSPGDFGGQRYSIGDMLICRGDVGDDEAVVLMARGHGRPRLGWVRGDALSGEAGEPCSVSRWRAAGRIVAVLQGDPSSLSVIRSASQVVSMPMEHRRPARRQLSLFSRVAA